MENCLLIDRPRESFNSLWVTKPPLHFVLFHLLLLYNNIIIISYFCVFSKIYIVFVLLPMPSAKLQFTLCVCERDGLDFDAQKFHSLSSFTLVLVITLFSEKIFYIYMYLYISWCNVFSYYLLN